MQINSSPPGYDKSFCFSAPSCCLNCTRCAGPLLQQDFSAALTLPQFNWMNDKSHPTLCLMLVHERPSQEYVLYYPIGLYHGGKTSNFHIPPNRLIAFFRLAWSRGFVHQLHSLTIRDSHVAMQPSVALVHPLSRSMLLSASHIPA